MKKPILVVMAAGMGSRYGGLPIHLTNYVKSVYSAALCGVAKCDINIC